VSVSLKDDKATPTSTSDQRVLVLDFGSQFAQLIARRVREQNVYCEIVRHDISPENIAKHNPNGLILSGGPNSVYEDGAPKCDPGIFDLDIPVLGICYGMQLVCDQLGGKVDSCPTSEYGRAICQVKESDKLFDGFPAEDQVWMSHGDQVHQVSDDFVRTAVPSRSHPHSQRIGPAEELPHASLWLHRNVEAGGLCRGNDRQNS